MHCRWVALAGPGELIEAVVQDASDAAGARWHASEGIGQTEPLSKEDQKEAREEEALFSRLGAHYVP